MAARSTRKATQFPVLEALALPELRDADGVVPLPHQAYDGLRFSALSLADEDGFAADAAQDLTGVTFSECEIAGLTGDDVTLRGARVTETRISQLNVPRLRAARSVFRDVELFESRVGALEAHDAEFTSVLMAHSKLGWANFRSATLRRVVFRDCVFSELDFGGATLDGVVFDDCRVDALQIDGARLKNVDLRGLTIQGSISDAQNLRGATISSAQATDLTSAFAAHLGIRIAD